MSLPYIIKSSQTVWELWHAQDFSFRHITVHNEESESCISCTPHAYWSYSLSLPNIIKTPLRVLKLWSAQLCVYWRMPGAESYIPEPLCVCLCLCVCVCVCVCVWVGGWGGGGGTSSVKLFQSKNLIICQNLNPLSATKTCREKSLDISRQFTNVNLFSLENKKKKNKNVICCSCDWCFNGSKEQAKVIYHNLN